MRTNTVDFGDIVSRPGNTINTGDQPCIVQTLVPVVNHAVRLYGLGQLTSVFVPLLEPSVENFFHCNVDVQYLAHGVVPSDARHQEVPHRLIWSHIPRPRIGKTAAGEPMIVSITARLAAIIKVH